MTRARCELAAGNLGYNDLRDAVAGPVSLAVATDSRELMRRSAGFVRDLMARGVPAYGITTGFGLNSDIAITPDQSAELQHRLVLSHCTGVGELMPDRVVRLILLLKVNALAQGYSGVRPELVDVLLRLLAADALPCVPSQGSVGASGDLPPLAQIGAAMMGIGRIKYRGIVCAAADVLRQLDLVPYRWEPKEGLALINATQASAAYAIAALIEAEETLAAATVAGALSVEAALGSASPFHESIHAARRQRGQATMAAAYRLLLEGGSRRSASPGEQRFRQDPYSLRCQPQVMGACLDQLVNAADVLLREANGVTDNPLLTFDHEHWQILNGGNFHAEGVAMAADNMALAVAEIGSLSERRTAVLIDSRFSGLPAFLAHEPGLDSGFMIAHVTAAALVSENKSRAYPCSVDSIPTSANQEDHVSMATHGSRRLLDMTANLRSVIAIECLAACQAIDMRPSGALAEGTLAAYRAVRDLVPPMKGDRYFAPDIEAATRLIQSGVIGGLAPIFIRPTALAESRADPSISWANEHVPSQPADHSRSARR